MIKHLFLLCFFLFTFQQTALAEINDVRWKYEWETAWGYPYYVELDIQGHMIKKAFLGEGDLLSYEKISDSIFQEIKRVASSFTDDKVKIEIIGKGLDDYSITAFALPSDQETADFRIWRIQKTIEEMIVPLEARSYYFFDRNRNTISINYNKIIREYESVIRGMLTSLSTSSGLDDRLALRDMMLDMLQSITYTDLDDDDFPLFNPVRMLIERRGDCESKQLFMAASMKMLFPEYSVHLVMLPRQQHIIMKYRNEYGDEVYMDATGPARVPAGQIPPEYSVDEGLLYEIQL